MVRDTGCQVDLTVFVTEGQGLEQRRGGSRDLSMPEGASRSAAQEAPSQDTGVAGGGRAAVMRKVRDGTGERAEPLRLGKANTAQIQPKKKAPNTALRAPSTRADEQWLMPPT